MKIQTLSTWNRIKMCICTYTWNWLKWRVDLRGKIEHLVTTSNSSFSNNKWFYFYSLNEINHFLRSSQKIRIFIKQNFIFAFKPWKRYLQTNHPINMKNLSMWDILNASWQIFAALDDVCQTYKNQFIGNLSEKKFNSTNF